MSKEIPILFSAPMVQAILEGRKTQTRRIIKPQPELCHGCQSCEFRCDHFIAPVKQRWQIGDELWVQENYALNPASIPATYICNYDDGEEKTVVLDIKEELKLKNRKSPVTKKQPGRFMYRSCGRILLEVTDIRVERLQDITEEGAIAEGIELKAQNNSTFYRVYGGGDMWQDDPLWSFRSLWESINGAGSWDANLWVWVIEFTRVEDATL